MKTIKRVIPKALREQVWLKFVGKRYETKCYIRWLPSLSTFQLNLVIFQ